MTKLLAVPFVVVALAGCPQLANMNTPPAPVAPPPRPEVKVSKITLDARPTNARLASHYCTQAAGGGLAAMACRVFGDVPRRDELKFTFRVELEAQNKATIPMPVASALVAFAAYPDDTGGQNLGSVCIEMCKDPNNCPQSANACDSSEPEIRGARDFAAAAAGFLLSTALNGGSKVELTMPMVAPGTALSFVATLALDIDQMLALIKRASRDALAQLTRGTKPAFQIPWAIEGSVWVRFEGFGRIGAGFPRQTGLWALE
jgi:hypothetical protein